MYSMYTSIPIWPYVYLYKYHRYCISYFIFFDISLAISYIVYVYIYICIIACVYTSGSYPLSALSSPSFKYFCLVQPQSAGVHLVTGSGRGPPGKLQILRCWFTEKQQTQYVSFNFRSNCKAAWLIEKQGFENAFFPNSCWLGSSISGGILPTLVV